MWDKRRLLLDRNLHEWERYCRVLFADEYVDTNSVGTGKYVCYTSICRSVVQQSGNTCSPFTEVEFVLKPAKHLCQSARKDEAIASSVNAQNQVCCRAAQWAFCRAFAVCRECRGTSSAHATVAARDARMRGNRALAHHAWLDKGRFRRRKLRLSNTQMQSAKPESSVDRLSIRVTWHFT